MKTWAWIVFCSVAFLACDNDGSSVNLMSDAAVADVGQPESGDATPSDMGTVQIDDARVIDATSSNGDDASTLSDGAVEAADSTTQDSDSTVIPLQDAGLVDAGQNTMVDANTTQMTRRSAGQCGDDDDCPNGVNGQNCSRALPGGTCLGCGTDSDCPSGAACNFGTCVVTCVTDEDCAPGLSCLSRGRCGATACVNGLCPDVRFDCSDGDRCTRRACDSTDDCVTGTACLNGLCIESDWL